MRLPDSELSGVPTCLYGGASGAVGLVASLPRDLYELLAALQNGLNKVGACTRDNVVTVEYCKHAGVRCDLMLCEMR
jgi:hypothetical protein